MTNFETLILLLLQTVAFLVSLAVFIFSGAVGAFAAYSIVQNVIKLLAK